MRRIAVLVLLAVLAAACGSGSAATKKGADAPAGKNGNEFTKAIEASKGFGSSASDGVFPRTVVHAKGKTVIPAAPQRVVVLSSGELDATVSLGVVPIAATPVDGSNLIPSYLANQLRGAQIARVGSTASPSLEAISALHPDLILGSDVGVGDLYKLLSKIAPTVLSIRTGYTWKQDFLLAAAALGKTGRAHSILQAYQKKAAALGKKFGTNKPTISLVRFTGTEIRAYAGYSFPGTILTDIGLRRPGGQGGAKLWVGVSAEVLGRLDADWIFYGVLGAPGRTRERDVTSAPLWHNLGAVRQGHAIGIADSLWYLGIGPTAAQTILGELEHRWTSYPHAGVSPSCAGSALAEPLVIKSKTTRPSNVGVNDDAANMGPILDYPEVGEAKRPEANDLRASFAQPFGVSSPERLCAERVVDQIDGDARLCSLDENLLEHLGHLT